MQKNRFGAALAVTGLVVGLLASLPTTATAAPAHAGEGYCGIGAAPNTLESDVARTVGKSDSGFSHFNCVFLDVSSKEPIPEQGAEVVKGWAPSWLFDNSMEVTTPSGVRIWWGTALPDGEGD